MLWSNSLSLLQASIAEPSLPLLISSPQRLTAWWCRFMCIPAFFFRRRMTSKDVKPLLLGVGERRETKDLGPGGSPGKNRPRPQI